MLPYGIQMALPTYPLLAITELLEGQPDNRFTTVTDPVNRDTNLKAGEVAFGIPALKARLTFKQDGSILIKNVTGNTITMSSTGVIIQDTGGNELQLSPEGSQITIGKNPLPLTGFCSIPNCIFCPGVPHTTNTMSNI
jgi:hypothetical protein